MSEQVVQPTENRRQCLIWTGILCAIAYVIYAAINAASLIKFDFTTYEEVKSYNDFIILLGLIGTFCFIGGMVSLLVFKPNHVTPYLGLMGACLYFILILGLYCEWDFVQEIIQQNYSAWIVLLVISVALMTTPVFLLKDRVVSGVRYIGMIGAAIIIELVVVNIIRICGDNVYLSEAMRTFLTSFELFGQLALFVLYVTVLACWNKGNVNNGMPYKWYEGRSRRSEYWLKVVILMAIAFIGGIAIFVSVFNARSGSGLAWDFFDLPSGFADNLGGAVLAFMMWLMPFSFAAIPVNVRRLHDRDMTGWWLLFFMVFSLVPFVGWVVPIIQFVIIGCLEGTVGPNQYGPDPKAAEHERLRAMFAASSNSTPTLSPTPTPTPTPTPNPAPESRQSVEDRLVNLQGLKDKGLITDEEYKEKRETILAEL